MEEAHREPGGCMLASLTRWSWRWGPVVLVMALIFVASGTPGRDLPSFGAWNLLATKGGHMTGYALLAASCLRGLVRTRSVSRRLVILALVLTGVTRSPTSSTSPSRPGGHRRWWTLASTSPAAPSARPSGCWFGGETTIPVPGPRGAAG